MKIKFSLGWNRVKPPHELYIGKDEFIQCSVLQNYICRDNKIKKIAGSNKYNSSVLANNIPWIKRSYHKQGDGSFVKRTLCFNNGVIYYGNDSLGTLTKILSGFSATALPSDMTIQVSGNSILYFFTGNDTPYKYDGNASYTIEKSTLASNIISGIVHPDLARAFYVKNNSSEIDYSETLEPENIADTIIAGNDKDSVNMAIGVGADGTLYIFKNNSIYQLYGRTSSTFQVRQVTAKYGLASRRGIYPVGSGFVFLNEFDKELYFFGGSESSIQSLTEKDIKLREIMNLTSDAVERVCMTVHDGLFRFSFQHRESLIDANNCELVYATSEPRADGLPKWSLIKGSNVLCYSVWNEQGDSNELLTGRSDMGAMMYQNRGLDFDGNATETIVRTGEVTFSEDMVCNLLDIFIKAKPGSYNISPVFKYFLNGRFSDGGITSLSMKGETRDVGVIHLQKQSLFNDRIVPLSNYRRGNSISFEISDNNNGTDLELYSIAFNVEKLYKIRNQYV